MSRINKLRWKLFQTRKAWRLMWDVAYAEAECERIDRKIRQRAPLPRYVLMIAHLPSAAQPLLCELLGHRWVEEVAVSEEYGTTDIKLYCTRCEYEYRRIA